MGVKIFDIIPVKEISLKDLSNKIIVIDGNLHLYQFLSSIRQRDGTLLMDSKGNITSHLTGIFNRSTRLMQQNIKLCYVFDGEPPALKKHEREKRHAIKEEAQKKYEHAKSEGNVDDMKKFASRTSKLTKEMVDEAKKLTSALGIPTVQAPSEGEAQAAHIVKNGDAYAVGTQDADSFMFNATRIIKNLTINSQRKSPNKLSYASINPELIEISEVLNSLGVDREQLIALCMLIGTDYNPGGIKGIGPKNALKLVKQHQNDFDTLFQEVKWKDYFDYKWEEVFYLIKNMKVTDDYKLAWQNVDVESVKKILVDNHDFSEQRVNHTLEKLKHETNNKQQTGLNRWM